MYFRRNKTTNGTGLIQRYYELGEEQVALPNRFYEIIGNKAFLLTPGTVPEPGNLIGFSHGGDKLAKGLIFLDVNPAVLYMCILEADDTARPDIGEVVDGFLRVIDTHYEETKFGKGTEKVGEIDGIDVEEWGIEDMDVPYFMASMGCGGYGTKLESTDGPSKVTIKIKNVSDYADATVVATPYGGGDVETSRLAKNGGIYTLEDEVNNGNAISTVYSSIEVVFDNAYTVNIDTTAELTENVVYTVETEVPDPQPGDNVVVIFRPNGGSEVPAQVVEPGDLVVVPTAPTKEGYTFDAWYSDSGLTTEFDFTVPVTGDEAVVLLYAKWTEN